MKRKEIVNMAKKIAKLEQVIQSGSPEEATKAQEEILKLSRNIHNLDDMMQIDELVMEILEKT